VTHDLDLTMGDIDTSGIAAARNREDGADDTDVDRTGVDHERGASPAR
jgi:hypothetical protein